MDIHNYKQRLDGQIALVKKQSDISNQDKQKIIEFKDYLLSEGIGYAKIARYLIDIRKLAVMLKKSLQDAGEKDLRRVVAEIEQSPLSPETKKSFKVLTRKFYRFLRGVTDKGVYPEEVRWISINIPKNHRKLPEEILTEAEVAAIIQNCTNLRDKALITCLYESGCRIGEIMTLKMKHISFEEYGARLMVTGKTGMRKILVINSAPYLQSWLNEHPQNNSPDAIIWIGPSKSLLSYARASHILKNAAQKAGIKKRVHLHGLRHARATHLADKMPEAAMKSYFGWGQDSKMCSTYIHLSGQQTDDAILRANGIEIKKDGKETLTKPQICLKCQTANEFTNRVCKACGMILSLEEARMVIQKETDRDDEIAAMKQQMKIILQGLAELKKQKTIETGA